MRSLRKTLVLFNAGCAAIILAGCSSEADPSRPGDTPPTPAADAAAPPEGAPSLPTKGPCTTSNDCASEDYCDLTKDRCVAAPNGAGCPVNSYPSGVSIQTFPDATATAEYDAISDIGSYPKPMCFLNLDRLYDPSARIMHPLSVKLAPHFALDELVGTELPYSHAALVSPTLVSKLEAFRTNWGKAVSLTSGYRSPTHQRAVCRDICGQDSCPQTCAARSRHSWGDAVDVGVYPTQAHADAACKALFNFVYLEGNHLHLDLNPEHTICTVNIL